MTHPTAHPAGRLEIQVDWLGRDTGDPLERATAAEIGIALPDGTNLTKIEDAFARTVRGTARLSAHHLAAWFTANWWRLRWEPSGENALGWRMSHHLAAAGGGYVWPDIVFASDGERVRISARPTSGAPFESVVYLAGGEELVEAGAFEAAVDRFVETTVARLCATGLETADLVPAWRELGEERRDPEASAYRRLEAISGFDPDEAPVALMEERLALAQAWGAEAVEDIVAPPRPGPPVDVQRSLDDARRHAEPIVVPDAADLRAMWPASDREAPWTTGYRLADAMRRRYRLGLDPVGDDLLTGLFALRAPATCAAAGVDPLAAAFRDGSPDRLDVRLTMARPAARRFQLMRLVGGHLTASAASPVVPATRAATARQKVQRAFAAAFLCPIDGLREMLPSPNPADEDVEVAADHYGVSTDVVRNILANRAAAPIARV